MMSIAITPTTAKSSGRCAAGASGSALSATTVATAEEEDVVEDAGTAGTRAKDGVISLVKTVGRSSLVTPPGVTSLVRVALRATQACLRCHNRQEGTTTTARETKRGASRSHAGSRASWEEPTLRLLTASSSSSLVR